MDLNRSLKAVLPCAALVIAACSISLAQETTPIPGWQRQDVDLHVGAGMRVRAIYAPVDRPAPFRGTYQRSPSYKRFAGPASTGVQVGIINSPPLSGFVPYITVVATDEKDLDTYSSTPWDSLVGTPFVSDPAVSYAVGLYDTGASSSVIGYASANQMGLYAASQLTENTNAVTGVTGSVDCFTSKPIGLFVDGLQAVDPQSLLLSTDAMRGQGNYCALVGPEPVGGAPDLATAIGAPMAAYFDAVFRNDQPVTRVINGQVCTGPSIRLYENASDPAIPAYPNWIDLQYLPDGSPVTYFPCISMFFGCPDDDQPWIPSLIGGGNLAQSLFFISQSVGVDLSDNGHSRTFYKFIVDTGAQVSVIGSTVVARLALNTNNPDFQVDIQGVDGQTIIRPGFYLDTMDIPGVGDWLSFAHVPVVYLDVASPECVTCKLDGIIGMNLLEKYNFVVHGGLYDGSGPSIAFERIAIWGDYDGDYDVDHDDVLQFVACARGANVAPANPDCLFFDDDGDGDVDQSDFGAFQACFSGTNVDADPKCHPVQ